MATNYSTNYKVNAVEAQAMREAIARCAKTIERLTAMRKSAGMLDVANATTLRQAEYNYNFYAMKLMDAAPEPLSPAEADATMAMYREMVGNYQMCEAEYDFMTRYVQERVDSYNFIQANS